MKEEDDFDDAKKSTRKTKRLCVSIDQTVFNSLERHCDSAGYDKSRLVEKIVLKYLEKFK